MLTILSILLLFVAGASWGVHEKINHHWSQFAARFPRANPQYWNPAISWTNKYKAWPDDKTRTLVPVFLTDAKHLLVSISQSALFSGGVLLIFGTGVDRPFWHYILFTAACFVSYTVGNLLTFNWLYRPISSFITVSHMESQSKSFSASNLNFWARLLIFFFSVLGLTGIKFPDTPTDLATDITTSLTGGGFIGVIGLLTVSVLMPIINFIRTKPKVGWLDILGSANFWIYLGSFVFGIAILFGIQIPDGTSEAVVEAIYTKNWSALFTIAVANILDPLVRWFKDKRAAVRIQMSNDNYRKAAA